MSDCNSKHICLCPSLPKLTLNDVYILYVINVDFGKYLLIQEECHQRNGNRDGLALCDVKLTLQQPSVTTYSVFVL